MSFVTENRKSQIIKLLEQHEKVKVADVADYLEVSQETIRRYFTELEEEGRLKKVYGGAVRLYGYKQSQTEQEEVLSLQKIAKKAAAFVTDGERIYLDESNVAAEMVRYLSDKKHITILTSSFRIIDQLHAYARANPFSGKVILLSGEVNVLERRIAHYDIEKQLLHFHVDKAFLWSNGFDGTMGFTCYHFDQAEMAKQMIMKAKQTYILITQHDIGKRQNYIMCHERDVYDIITDCD